MLLFYLQTTIPCNLDLTTTDFLIVTKYYCTSNQFVLNHIVLLATNWLLIKFVARNELALNLVVLDATNWLMQGTG